MIRAPLVSVIVTTLDRPVRLQQAILSVVGQTYEQLEVIIVNDGGESIDHVIEQARYTCSRPIRYIALSKTTGVAAARNAGANLARGEILALLDDDDRYRPHHIEHLVNVLMKEREAVLAYDDVLILVEDGTVDDPQPHIAATCRFGLPYNPQILERDDYIVPSSMVFRRADFERAGGFAEKFSIYDDWDYLLRLRHFGHLRYFGSEIGVEYSLRLGRSDNLSATFNDKRAQLLEQLAQRHNLSRLEQKTFLDVAQQLGFTMESFAS